MPRMLELSTDEYPLVLQPLIKAKGYFKDKDPELDKMLAEAIQILKKSAKGVPLGGSHSNLSREQKIKKIFQTFGIDKRI